MFILLATLTIATILTVRFPRLRLILKQSMIVSYAIVQIIKLSIMRRIRSWFNVAPVKLDDNHIVVSYIYNDREYKQIVRVDRHPKNILSITTDDNIDVTNELSQYLNPTENLVTSCITPETFGCQTLHIEHVDGTHTSL